MFIMRRRIFYLVLKDFISQFEDSQWYNVIHGFLYVPWLDE